MSDASPQRPKPRFSAKQGIEKLKDRLKKLFEEYGNLAIVVFVVISAITYGSIWMAIKTGWNPESAAGETGSLLAAYVVYRPTIFARVPLTVVLTPIIARILEKLRLRRPRPPLS